LSWICFGVCDGANTPTQNGKSESGKPASASVDPSGQQLGQRFLHAAERNLLHLDAGAETETLGVDMRGPAVADGGIVQRAGPPFGGGDKLARGLVFLRRDHQQERRVDERHYAGEVALGVVGQRAMGRREDRERRRVGEQRIAVGIGLGHRRGGERASAAAAVVDEEGLADLLRDLVEYRAADEIDRAPGGDRYRDANRLARPWRGLRLRRPERAQRQ
jgi:hypothetical protein